MTEFILHTVPSSPFGRGVMAAFAEKDVRYTLSAMPPGTAVQPAHRRLHPFGKAPVLNHNGFVLYETQAILRYLDRILPGPSLTPADFRHAALMDQIMSICDWYLFQGVNRVIGYERTVAPRLGRVADEAAIERALPAGQLVFGVLDRFAREDDYLAGPSLSLADLMIAPQIAVLASVPEWTVLTAETPGLVEWYRRVTARPSLAPPGSTA